MQNRATLAIRAWLILMMVSTTLCGFEAAKREDRQIPIGTRELVAGTIVEGSANCAPCHQPPCCQSSVDAESVYGLTLSSFLSYDLYPNSAHKAIEKFPGPVNIPLTTGGFCSLPAGVYVRLEDGTIVRIADEDVWASKDWLPHDTLHIIPFWSWFDPPLHLRPYKYCLCNLNTNVKVRVKLEVGPRVSSPHRRWIRDLNPVNKELVLNDGSFWQIANRDAGEFSMWLPEDSIEIGVNYDDILSYRRPNVLINMSTGGWVRATWCH